MEETKSSPNETSNSKINRYIVLYQELEAEKQNEIKDSKGVAFQSHWLETFPDLELYIFNENTPSKYYGLLCKSCQTAFEKNPKKYTNLSNNNWVTAGYRTFKKEHIKTHMTSNLHQEIKNEATNKVHLKIVQKKDDPTQNSLETTIMKSIENERSKESFFILIKNLHFVIKNINPL
jgi:uncharacterized glyoxalase superfamily metalloenzyme YdcJ